jgi:hypothetical protein
MGEGMTHDDNTVGDILKTWLKAGGYDGLFNSWSECACEIDDLAPCGNVRFDCKAGYKVNDCLCGQGCDFHIVETKPETKP